MKLHVSKLAGKGLFILCICHIHYHPDPQSPFKTRLFQIISYETNFHHRTYKLPLA